MRNRIKELRVDSDLTQNEIAKAIKITQRKYSYLERGIQPATDEFLIKLAKYYGTSIDYILCLTDNPRPYS